MILGTLAAPLGKKLRGALGKYKYVLAVILLGILLLTLPSFGEKKNGDSGQAAAGGGQAFDLTGMEEKLEEALSKIEGAGNVTVILTVKTGARQVLAEEESSRAGDEIERSSNPVVVSRGSGYQDVVPVQEISPQFQGALVVCAGGGNPAVKLKLVEAVSALTGLGSDRISICKGK